MKAQPKNTRPTTLEILQDPKLYAAAKAFDESLREEAEAEKQAELEAQLADEADQQKVNPILIQPRNLK